MRSTILTALAFDYLEGFYEGDSAKIVRSVRSDVHKVGYYTERGSATYIPEVMSYAEMITYTTNFRKRGRTTPATAPREEMTVHPKSGAGPDITDKGKYITVWELQPDGSWKIIRDISNSDNPVSR